MKNSQFIPFERNKYYYGKLLSVEDFNLEQKYMNDKRRLINRLALGTGILAGMNVICTDEQTLSIEKGVALDNYGREVVIDAPVTKKLSLIDGYDSCINGGFDRYMYLCIEYDEQDKGAVHNIADPAGAASNRIKEGYRLFLTGTEPTSDMMKAEDLYEDAEIVFSDGTVKIRQIVPKFVPSGGRFEMRVEIENIGKRYLSFSYDVHLTCLASDRENTLRVTFDEALQEKTGAYTLTFPIDVFDVTSTDGILAVDPASFILAYDKRRESTSVSCRSVTRITEKDVKDEVTDGFYRTALDTVLHQNGVNYLYLAKIFLVSAGSSFVIERIEEVPFKQYVANQLLHTATDQLLAASAGAPAENTVEMRREREAAEMSPKISSGVCRISLGVGGQKNQNFFSEEIIHGLGLGSVTIILGLQENGQISYGSSYIFAEDAPKLQLAAKLDPSKGTFVIGARLLLATTEEFVDVKWTAIRDVNEKVNEKQKMKIFIKPATLMLKTRESYYLEAVCDNMPNKTVLWSCAEGGGFIDANGMYIAPNLPGIYEVIARSAAYPEITASVMVVVRE